VATRGHPETHRPRTGRRPCFRCPARTEPDRRPDPGREFERQVAEWNILLLQPTREGEVEHAGVPLFAQSQQVVESVNESFKGSSTSRNTAAARAASSFS
jgi:hypothetical protein